MNGLIICRTYELRRKRMSKSYRLPTTSGLAQAGQ